MANHDLEEDRFKVFCLINRGEDDTPSGTASPRFVAARDGPSQTAGPFTIVRHAPGAEVDPAAPTAPSTYKFHAVFPPDTTRRSVYAATLAAGVDRALKGRDAAYISYGGGADCERQTATAGDGPPRGNDAFFDLVEHFAADLYEAAFVAQMVGHCTFAVEARMLFLHCERLIDLDPLSDGERAVLTFADSDAGGAGRDQVCGLSSTTLHTLAQFTAYLRMCLDGRRNAAGAMRAGHTFLLLRVTNRSGASASVANLVFADLSGFRRVYKKGSIDSPPCAEARAVNMSIIGLMSSVRTWLERADGRVPVYRSSLAARVLANAFFNPAWQTSLLCAVQQAGAQFRDESLSTLHFGSIVMRANIHVMLLQLDAPAVAAAPAAGSSPTGGARRPSVTAAAAEPSDDQMCVVCMGRQSTSAFLPCGHRCVCCECAEQMRQRRDKCPICRSDTLIGIFRIF